MKQELQWKTKATEPRKPPCTLLVPAALEPYLRTRYRQHGPLIAYLAFLLGRAAVYRQQERLPEVDRVTRKYQRKKQNLQRWHVRIPGELWTELRALAGGCGITMSHMFVVLTLLDKEDQENRTHDGAPTFWGTKIALLEGVDIDEAVTRRKIRFRVDTDPPPGLLRQIRGRRRRH